MGCYFLVGIAKSLGEGLVFVVVMAAIRRFITAVNFIIITNDIETASFIGFEYQCLILCCDNSLAFLIARL